jgi:hypothetical protein
MDCFASLAMTVIFFALQQFTTKTRSKRPLLTGNGLSPGFSLYVRLAYKASGAAQGRAFRKK